MYIYLIFSIIFSVLFAICYKIAVQKSCNLQAVNTWNYAGAAITVVAWMIIQKNFLFNIDILILAIVSGISSYFATYTFFLHIKQGQLSTSWTIISLSVAFPVLASILIWHEQPNLKQIVAMIIIVIAFIIIGNKKSHSSHISKLSFIYLIIAFILSGLGGIYFKAITEMNMKTYTLMYMLILYISAFILGTRYIIGKNSDYCSVDIGVGSFMGFSGAISSILLLKSLESIQGIIVFPARSIGNLILTAILSIILWKDKLSVNQWIGIVLSIIAIWLVI